MKKSLFFAIAIAACTSCSNNDSSCDPVDPAKAEITLQAILADVKPESKTSYSGSTASWDTGDQIGVFCPQSVLPGVNTAFTATVTGDDDNKTVKWSTTTPIYWGLVDVSHTFTAYAPYVGANSDLTTIALPALNAQTGSLNAAQDFLISNNYATAGVMRPGPVNLVFKHAFSLIELKVAIGLGVSAGATLANFTIAGTSGVDKIYTGDGTSTISLSDATMTLKNATHSGVMTPVTPPILSTTPISVYTMILPGTYSAPKLSVVLKELGITLSLPAISMVTTTFEAGKKYSYSVNVARQAITISSATITDWVTVTITDPINPIL